MGRNWEMLKEKFVCGKMTLAELSEQNGVPYSVVRKHASKEKWNEQREAFRQQVSEKARNAAAKRRGKREADVLLQIEEICEELINVIKAALEDENQLYRHILSIKNGEQDERVLKILNTKTARELVDTVSVLQSMVARHGNILDKRASEEIKIKKQRLLLDKEKAGLSDNNDSETGIALMPDLDETCENVFTLPTI